MTCPGVSTGSGHFLQVLTDVRKHGFSAPDEVSLERKGSVDSQASFDADAPLTHSALRGDRAPEHKALVR